MLAAFQPSGNSRANLDLAESKGLIGLQLRKFREPLETPLMQPICPKCGIRMASETTMLDFSYRFAAYGVFLLST
jgi:hypothetical protein